MIRIFVTIGIICLSAVLFGWVSSTGKSHASKKAITTDSPELNYKNFCSGCHGERMDAFVDRKWKHGNEKDDLFKAIKVGYADEGMPAFDSAFSDKAIHELVDYIVTGIENVKRYQFQETAVKENYFVSDSLDIKLDTIARGFTVGWGMAFLPGGSMLVTDKSGKMYKVDKKKKMQEVSGVPPVLFEGQGGLMDVIIHPQFAKNKLVYLSFSMPKKFDTVMMGTTAIMRATLEGNKLVNSKIIFEAMPYSKTRHHYGSRMVFGKDGKLYFSVGERGNEKENPQSLSRDLGKIHRINDDGTIPKDNPFVNTADAKPSIYSYGHRNPQGLTFNPATGELWENEHGPRGGDEINLIKKADNYGWPVVTYGINYNGKTISDKSVQPGIEDALLYWIPSIGPSGMAFVEGNRYPGWKGSVMVGSLRFKYLNRCEIKGHKIVKQEMLLKNIGRVRDVRMAPDGYIYISVENPGYIFRLVPVKKK